MPVFKVEITKFNEEEDKQVVEVVTVKADNFSTEIYGNRDNTAYVPYFLVFHNYEGKDGKLKQIWNVALFPYRQVLSITTKEN